MGTHLDEYGFQLTAFLLGHIVIHSTSYLLATYRLCSKPEPHRHRVLSATVRLSRYRDDGVRVAHLGVGSAQGTSRDNSHW
jgi:hypothetical protein